MRKKSYDDNEVRESDQSVENMEMLYDSNEF